MFDSFTWLGALALLSGPAAVVAIVYALGAPERARAKRMAARALALAKADMAVQAALWAYQDEREAEAIRRTAGPGRGTRVAVYYDELDCA